MNSSNNSKKELSNEERRRVIESYDRGNTAAQIASIMGYNRTTIHKIIKIYIDENRIEKKLKGGQRKKSLQPSDKLAIKQWIEEDCGLTLKMLKTKCELELGVVTSEKTIDRAISEFEFTMKRIHLMPGRRNDDQALETRSIYAERYLRYLTEIDDSKIFFLDEIGFNVSMRVRRGRSLVGHRAVLTVGNLRARNISVCCIMSKGGVYKFTTKTSAFNGDLFKIFVEEILAQFEVDQIRNSLIILDNVAFHKRNDIKNLIVTAGHQLFFLPPYSPFLNPIENMFSKWKQLIRQRKPENESQLFSYIDECSADITVDNCSEYYRHMMGFMIQCLNKQPIIEE